MPHLPPVHYETSKRDSPNEPNIKEKQNETIPDSNWNLAKLMTHHNQTKELTTWFLTKKASRYCELHAYGRKSALNTRFYRFNSS
jgi:hypothetical protein